MHSSGMQTYLNGGFGEAVQRIKQRICQKRNTLFKIPNISHTHTPADKQYKPVSLFISSL